MKTSYVKSTTPVLTPQALEALKAQYSRTAGHASVNALSQGERDVLDMARQAIGWATITSLAHKYYPLYPARQWWKRALERCSHQKIRCKTLPIQYLLLTLQTVKALALKAAFTGKEALNRLVHSTNSTKVRGTNRLVLPGGIVNVPGLDTERYTVVELLHERQKYYSGECQFTGLAGAAA